MAYAVTKVYQGSSFNVRVYDHDIDLTGETVHLYVVAVDTSDDETTKQSLGSADGENIGTDILIPCTFAIDRGRYYWEIATASGIILYPPADSDTIEYLDIRDSYVLSD